MLALCPKKSNSSSKILVKTKTTTLGITGGIGSGKTFICRMLEQMGIPVFYTDDEAKLEMKENTLIHQQLRQLIGPQAVSEDHCPVKAVLSEYICRGKDHADHINAIVHPQVKLRTQRWINAQAPHPVVAIESALLFESGFDSLCTKTITVAAPLHVRLARVCQRDSISPAQAQRWIDLQMPQEEKVRRSDFTINNDGNANIQEQINTILSQL